jgi:hypothetical protein
VGLRAGPDRWGKSWPHRPARRQSLYPLSYPGPHKVILLNVNVINFVELSPSRKKMSPNIKECPPFCNARTFLTTLTILFRNHVLYVCIISLVFFVPISDLCSDIRSSSLLLLSVTSYVSADHFTLVQQSLQMSSTSPSSIRSTIQHYFCQPAAVRSCYIS